MSSRLIILALLITGIVFLSIPSCQSESEITYLRYYTSGKKLYEANCQNCHNSDGNGLAQLYPPLTDSIYLKQNKTKLACYIKYGLSGEIQIAGKAYNAQMPAQKNLSDIEIAEIVTYVTNSFGNKQGFYGADMATKDLKNCN
ncbi:MAG: c-type cytochrome [Sphingobacteriaceae bacterium]